MLLPLMGLNSVAEAMSYKQSVVGSIPTVPIVRNFTHISYTFCLGICNTGWSAVRQKHPKVRLLLAERCWGSSPDSRRLAECPAKIKSAGTLCTIAPEQWQRSSRNRLVVYSPVGRTLAR